MRPAADVQSRDLRDRRDGAEPLDEAVGLVHEVAVARRARADRSSMSAWYGRRRARRAPAARHVASSVAATSVSRFWRARSASAYLAAMISPCSVMRSRPATLPGGWARIAS